VTSLSFTPRTEAQVLQTELSRLLVSCTGQCEHPLTNVIVGRLQVSGEAGYTDDIKLSSDALVAVLVTSSKPHARLTRVDASKALEVTAFSESLSRVGGWDCV
jgi:hypothetical protein